MIDIIYKETENHIEVSITDKPAFEDQQKRKVWYDSNDLKDQDHKEELNLRKVPTFYCKAKFDTILAQFLHRTFSNNSPTFLLQKANKDLSQQMVS